MLSHEEQHCITNRGVVGLLNFLPREQQCNPTAILKKEVLFLTFDFVPQGKISEMLRPKDSTVVHNLCAPQWPSQRSF
jgi:hypothetical protein